MASFFVLGDNLISEQAYKESLETGEIGALIDAKLTSKSLSVDVDGISVKASEIKLSEDPKNPFKEIGIGKPLSAEILCIYSGDFIHGFLAGKKRDLLCVSGVKSSATFDATSRALNILEPKVKERAYLNFSSLQACTPYIYYTKAVDADSLILTVELDGDSYNEGLFNTISDLIGKAAGLPLFMPAASYLLAGSQLAKIAAEGGNALFESTPFLSASTTIRFATGGMPTNIARSMVICRDEHISEFDGYKTEVTDFNGDNRMRLVKDKKAYEGKAPYMIVNIDGAEKPSLESFTPTLASNAILKRFYGGNNKIEEASKILLDALSLYSDFNYKSKADKLKRRMEELSDKKDSPEYKNAESLYKAYVANIENPLFKEKK